LYTIVFFEARTSRTARDLRSKRERLGSAATRCTDAILAILTGDTQPVPHVAARLSKKPVKRFLLFREAI